MNFYQLGPAGYSPGQPRKPSLEMERLRQLSLRGLLTPPDAVTEHAVPEETQVWHNAIKAAQAEED